MFCPQCRAEYRQGFYRCSDCDVPLVHALPPVPEEPPDGPARNWVCVWSGEDARAGAEVSAKLAAAGIRLHLAEGFDRFFGGHDRSIRIMVPPAAADRAEEILDPEDPVEDPEELALMELPAQDAEEAEAGPTGEREIEEPDARGPTVEVWSGGPGEPSWMIEMSLAENHIGYRKETPEDGACRLYVHPDALGRAREIIREVVEAAPPE